MIRRLAARICRAGRASAVLACFLTAATAVSAQELITGLTHEKIYITSDFTGAELVVFGTVNNIQNIASAEDADISMRHYDVVVVIEGPQESGIVRKKERAAGIWINRSKVDFKTIPASYLMMSSTPHDEAGFNAALENLKIGLDHMPLGAPQNAEAFRDAVVRLKSRDGLYRQSTGIAFPGDNLFSAQFPVPALIPVGRHKVRSYLFVDNKLISESSHSITIAKKGFEQFLFDFSRQSGYLYGIVCVVLAMFTGWLSSVVFRRD